MRRSLADRTGALVRDDFDDPLIGLVNLFDIAMVFAVALVVALVFTVGSPLLEADRGESELRPLPNPDAAPNAAVEGGEQVGRVLRLPDGSLVYTVEGGVAPLPREGSR